METKFASNIKILIACNKNTNFNSVMLSIQRHLSFITLKSKG